MVVNIYMMPAHGKQKINSPLWQKKNTIIDMSMHTYACTLKIIHLDHKKLKDFRSSSILVSIFFFFLTRREIIKGFKMGGLQDGGCCTECPFHCVLLSVSASPSPALAWQWLPVCKSYPHPQELPSVWLEHGDRNLFMERLVHGHACLSVCLFHPRIPPSLSWRSLPGAEVLLQVRSSTPKNWL